MAGSRDKWVSVGSGRERLRMTPRVMRTHVRRQAARMGGVWLPKLDHDLDTLPLHRILLNILTNLLGG